METHRTPPKKKARELAKYFRAERVDYPYLKSVFRALREELEVRVPRSSTRLPEVPSEEDIRAAASRFMPSAMPVRPLSTISNLPAFGPRR